MRRTVAQTLNIPRAEQGSITAGKPTRPPTCHTTRPGTCRRHYRSHHQLMSLPPPITAQTKCLLLSRSLQRHLTHFSRVCSPDTIRESLSKLQAAVEDAAFSLFQIPEETCDLGEALSPLLEHFKRGCCRPRACSDSGLFSVWCTSRTQCGADQVSRICVSWLCQPNGQGCRPSGVAGG